MNNQHPKSRGPLLLFSGFVRNRPIAAIILGLLLVLIAGVSFRWALARFQRQRVQDKAAQTEEVRRQLIKLGRELHERPQEEKPPDATP